MLAARIYIDDFLVLLRVKDYVTISVLSKRTPSFHIVSV